MRLTLPEIKKKVSTIVPEGIDYDITLEAGSIAIVTKQPTEFSGSGENLTVRIAKSIKRRIVVRPHIDILSDEKDFNSDVIWSPKIIDYDNGEKLPVWIDLNTTASTQPITDCSYQYPGCWYWCSNFYSHSWRC